MFEDVSVGEAVEQAYPKRFSNCGQTCSAMKRLIVHESIFDQVVDSLKQIVESKQVGDPEDEKTDFGSLVSEKQRHILALQVEDAVSKGAKVIIGGKVPEGLNGAYFLPTLLTNITPEMKVWSEEVFGPVLPIVSFKTEDEALQLANDTPYGLSAQVFTGDEERALRMASRIEAGMIQVNKGGLSPSCNPFGGYKLSGMGRENGKYGLREMCQIKTVITKV